MHHRNNVRLLTAVAMCAAALLTACRDNPLSVENTNQADVLRAFGSPKDVETIASKLFQQMYNGQYGSSDDLWTQTMTMSFESASQLGNFGMGTRSAIPRGPIDNSIGNNVNAGNFRDFDQLSRNERGAANVLAAINRFLTAGNTIGSPARDAKAKSFAYFTLGYALGNLAMFYDSAAIVTATTASDEIPPLSASSVVIAAALADLDSALAISQSANATNGTSGWPIDAAWMSTNGTIDLPTWQRMIRSYRAKFRAGVARTPADRAAVNWATVIADATNGITGDFIVNASVTNGWAISVINQFFQTSGWSQMTPFILGMADTTGAYDTWLQQSLTSRTPFLLRTPDKRFPSGETRALQTAVAGTSKAGTAAGSILYFRNRPEGEDTPSDPWGTWYYDNQRFWGVVKAGGNGPFTVMTVVENDMLAAEGYIRTGNFAAAGALIDKSRVRAGLPSVAGITTASQVVPGGNACVPRVPQPPAFNTTACGNLFEAMKWEKRVETSFTSYGQWFLDSRGWGDLVVATPLEWPVPYQELFARLKGSYTTSARAAKGTYGF